MVASLFLCPNCVLIAAASDIHDHSAMPTTEPAELQGGTGSAASGPDTAAIGTSRYSVPQASRVLGISERAVRKRIEAGSLLAVREGRSWVVIIEHSIGGTGSARFPEPVVIDAAPGGPDAVRAESITAGAAGVDIRPLVEHIAKLEDRIQSLTEAATVWQIRAVSLEEQLKQLTAGMSSMGDSDQASGPHDDPDEPPARATRKTPESSQTHTMGSGATTGESPSDESNAGPSIERRGGFAGWWDRVMGR